jgi:multiple antibiotic resistance protein
VADAIKVFLLVLSALFPIVNPLGGGPLFLALTKDLTSEARRALALRVAQNSFFLMIGSYFVGSHLLGFFGVSLPVVQVGGGLIVVSMGWTLLMAKDQVATSKKRSGRQNDTFRQAFYPLTLPMTVGPGSISVAVTLGANTTHHFGVHVPIIIAPFLATGLIGASIYLCYGFADRLARILGEAVTSTIIRLSSFLMLCIGVQIVWNGISALLASVK